MTTQLKDERTLASRLDTAIPTALTFDDILLVPRHSTVLPAQVDVSTRLTRNIALTQVGTGVFDIMTYCGWPNNTWPMPVRWQRLWDQIG